MTFTVVRWWRARSVEIVSSFVTSILVVACCVYLPLPRTQARVDSGQVALDGQTDYSLDSAIVGSRSIRLRWHPQPEIAVRRGEALAFTGWAIDAPNDAPVSSVAAVIDGGIAFRGTIGQPRPDVAAFLAKPVATNSGFTIVIAPGALAAGPHRVAFRFFTAGGRNYYRSRDDVDIDVSR